ncbi:MAG: NHLP bacteriocin system secretion protein [Solobacterium sp.]|nr:NHLP bacteriocin system secretion protein [Solobacterium sp.]
MSKANNNEAINRLVSEDRLDKMIVLAPPATWISVAGAFVIIAGLLIWGFFGSLPTSVDAHGIFMNSSGSSEVFSQKEGFVLNVYVKAGDRISQGDILATLGTEDEMFQLKQYDTRIQYVEAMTFDSEYDIVSADTQEMANIKLRARGTDKDYETRQAELTLKKEKLQNMANDIANKEAVMLQYKEQYFSSLNVSDDQRQIAYNEASTAYSEQQSVYEAAKNKYITAKENYYALKETFEAKYKNYDQSEHSEAENAAYETEKEQVANALKQADDYEALMNQESQKLSEANTRLEEARKEYLEYLNSLSDVQAKNIIASTEYNEALNDYTTAKNQYQALSDEIDMLQQQVLIAEGNSQDSSEDYLAQFNNLKSAVLMDLKSQREAILNTASRGDIRSAVDGEIYDISLYPGEAVARGGKVATLLTAGGKGNTVVCYVSVDDIKKIHEGMEAYVYPSTVKQEEYGHIEGVVTELSSHVASEDGMLKQLGSESLVTDFSKNGPVVEVRCSLAEDENTVSGYRWSSNRGDAIALESGTMIFAKIITENKSPIDLFIPYMREKLSMETAGTE